MLKKNVLKSNIVSSTIYPEEFNELLKFVISGGFLFFFNKNCWILPGYKTNIQSNFIDFITWIEFKNVQIPFPKDPKHDAFLICMNNDFLNNYIQSNSSINQEYLFNVLNNLSWGCYEDNISILEEIVKIYNSNYNMFDSKNFLIVANAQKFRIMLQFAFNQI